MRDVIGYPLTGFGRNVEVSEPQSREKKVRATPRSGVAVAKAERSHM
jgi:hypothetical protein